MRQVIHLIPYHGIGGVERAAATMLSVKPDDIEFQIQTIFPSSITTQRWMIWNPLYFLRTIARLWRTPPDVLIVSLWRAYAVGVVVKLLRPRTRLVVFLHSPNDVHIADRILTRLSASMATRIWSDSRETLTRRLPDYPSDKGQVISFVTDRIQAIPIRTIRPIFMFWGRIHVQKGLERALRILAAVRAQQPLAQFLVIGPDGGDLPRISALADTLELGDSVQFLGPMKFPDIRKVVSEASFYLQTSELEGMAMSVVEAMQLGLIPLVTPAGEIGHYARHGENAIVISNDASAVADILELLTDDTRCQIMRARAIATWSDKLLYKDSVLAACREALGMEASKF